MVEVHLRAVRVDFVTSNPVVLLEETEGARRSLAIFIGSSEATAIAYALQGVDPPRPMTHDLMRELVEVLGGRVVRVVVTELRDGTFFAELHLRSGERDVVVSARPSDAIALAVRVRAPLYVADELMDAEGLIIKVEEEDVTVEGNPDELLGEFKEFLDRISPEDFSS